MKRLVVMFFALLLGSACAPTLEPLQLPEDCRSERSVGELPAEGWLQQGGAWYLRQSMLLETRFRKLPMDGFLRLDLDGDTARLVALNEIGLVLFDLEVTPGDQTLHRIIPQLETRQGLVTIFARGLRRMFHEPRAAGNQVFTIDCRGDLREIRAGAESENWRVRYNRYQEHEALRLPREIVLGDKDNGIRLTFEIYEVKQDQ